MDFDNHRWMRTRALVAAMETQLTALDRSLSIAPPNAAPVDTLAQRRPLQTDPGNDAYCVPAAIATNLTQVTDSLRALAATLEQAPTERTAPPRLPVVRLVPDL